MRPYRLLAILAGLLAMQAPPSLAATAAGETRITVREPLPYGHQIGDVVVREITVRPAKGTAVAIKSLPKPGRANAWLELRAVDHQSAGGGATRLRLEYQVTNVPDAVRTVSLPEFAVPLDSAGKVVRLPVNPSFITIAPMTPGTVLGRDRLVDVQEDTPAPLVATDAQEARIRHALLASLIPLLALLYCWTPWERLLRPQRPFARALREASRQREASDEVFWPAALRALHSALDATAGRTVFPGETRNLVARHNAYARLEQDIAQWLEESRRLFYGAGAYPERGRRADLMRLLAEARAVERGIQ
jgi:mxaA protein